MNWKLKTPDMVHEAAKTGGKKLIMELLIFLAVFYVTQSMAGIPVSVAVVAVMFLDPVFLQASISGDINDILDMTMDLATSEAILLTSLFSTAITIGAVLFFCKVIQKRKLWTLGFKKAGMWKEYGIGMLAGLGMIGFIVLVCMVTGAASFQFNPEALSGAGIGMLLALLAGFLIQGMSEEVLCRGYFLVSVARKKGRIWLAVIVNAVAFGALHLLNPGLTVLSMVNLILFGIFASVYFVKRGNIWGIAAIHSVWNFVQGNLFGFLVSGQGFGTTLFTCELNRDLTILNGGDFGLEGGILTTAVMILGIAILLMTQQKDAVEQTPAVSAPETV